MLTPAPEQRLWYLVHCKPRQEQRAVENLERQGFECFRPVRRVEKLRLGRRQEVPEGLFPCYVFIHLDRIKDNWHPVHSTLGVNRIVRFGEFPIPVSDELIAEIRTQMNGAPLREPYLHEGERVIVNHGGFSQVEAIFVCDDGDERVVLLLNILNSEQRMSFPVAGVRRAR